MCYRYEGNILDHQTRHREAGSILTDQTVLVFRHVPERHHSVSLHQEAEGSPAHPAVVVVVVAVRTRHPHLLNAGQNPGKKIPNQTGKSIVIVDFVYKSKVTLSTI